LKKDCAKCGTSFTFVHGNQKICSGCRLDREKTTGAERVAAITEYLKKWNLVVHWMALDMYKERGYDAYVVIPEVGAVRISMGALRRHSEMGITTWDHITRGKDVKVVFHCARLHKGIVYGWRAKKLDYEAAGMPGICKCRGCGAKRFFGGCKVVQDVL